MRLLYGFFGALAICGPQRFFFVDEYAIFIIGWCMVNIGTSFSSDENKPIMFIIRPLHMEHLEFVRLTQFNIGKMCSTH